MTAELSARRAITASIASAERVHIMILGDST